MVKAGRRFASAEAKSCFCGGERQSFRPKFVDEMKCGFARTGFVPAGAREETWRFFGTRSADYLVLRVCTVGGGASRHAYTRLRARQRDDTSNMCCLVHCLRVMVAIDPKKYNLRQFNYATHVAQLFTPPCKCSTWVAMFSDHYPQFYIGYGVT